MQKPESLISAVLVPLAQAVITGLFIGLAIGAAAALFALEKPGVWGLAAGCIVMALAWLAYRSRWSMVVEKALGVDINLDGFIGDPPPEETRTVRIELVQDGGSRGDWIDLPTSPERLALLGDGLLNSGRTFNLSSWTGRGQPFTRREFEALRAALLERGLLVWRTPGSPAQGVELSPAGRAIMRRFASTTTPQPTVSRASKK